MKVIRICLSALLLLALTIYAGAREEKVCAIGFGLAGSGVLAAADDKEAAPETTFMAKCTDEGILFRVDTGGPFEGNDELEIYFRTSEALPDGNYYQFYTDFENVGTIFTEEEWKMLAQRGVPGRFDPAFRIHYSYFTERMPEFPYLQDYRTSLTETDAGGYVAEVFIPWNAMARFLPFDDGGKGKWWHFGVFRFSGEKQSVWRGQRRQPPTWGRLEFLDVSTEQLARIHHAIAEQNTRKTEPLIDPTLFDTASIRSALSAQEKERSALRNKLPEPGTKLDLAEMKTLADATSRMRALRQTHGYIRTGTRKEWKDWKLESVTTLPDGTETAETMVFIEKRGYGVSDGEGGFSTQQARDIRIPAFDKNTEAAKSLRLIRVFREDIADDLYITDLCADAKNLLCDISLNGEKIVTGHDPCVESAHFLLPAVNKGDRLVVTLREKNGNALNFRFFCRLESLRFGLRPRKALHYYAPNPQDRRFPLKPDQEYDMHFLGIYAGELVRLLQEKPRVIQFGGGFEIGFRMRERERRAELYNRYRLTHIGNVAENNLVTNLKLENYLLDYLAPEMIILNPYRGFTSDPEKVCEAVREHIRIIREKTPRTEIVILGSVPQSKNLDFVKSLNPMLENLAAEEGAGFRDPMTVFMNPDGTPKDHLLDLYMTSEGYRLWTELTVPDMDRLITDR